MRAVVFICALLVSGCATYAQLGYDRDAGKGTTRVYAIQPDAAWTMVRSVLRSEGAATIDEDRAAGMMMTSFPQTYGGVAGVWIEPDGDQTKITTIVRGGLLPESYLHQRFSGETPRRVRGR